MNNQEFLEEFQNWRKNNNYPKRTECREIYKLAEKKIKLEIKSDSYDMQCYLTYKNKFYFPVLERMEKLEDKLIRKEQECEQLKQKLNNAKQEAFDEFMSMDIYCVGLLNCDSRKIKERNRALNDEIKILKEALKKLGNFCTEENNLGGCGIHKDCSHCRRYFAQEQFARIENMNK